MQNLRSPLSVLAVALIAALGGAISTQASAQGLAGHRSDAPVNYAADRIELQDAAHRVLLSGNVDITQDDLRVRAARSTVNYLGGGKEGGGIKIQRLDASGGVLVTRGGESANGDIATYDFNRRIITLVGHVTLHRNGDTLNGGRMVIDLATGLSTVDGRGTGGGTPGADGVVHSGGRVSGSFAVPKAKQ